MNRFIAVTAALALTSVASAQTFSVNGAGGAVPDRPFGPGPLWNEAPNWTPFTSTVSVTAPVTSITHVVLVGFNHDTKFQVHAFLSDPNGVRHNVIVRPGYDNKFNDGGDFLLGDYDIVGIGGGTSSWSCCGTDISGGVYDQYLTPNAGGWTNNTTFPINNTPLNSITGPAGTWTLTIYDWESDAIPLLPPSNLLSWNLQGTLQLGGGPPPPTTICEPGLNGVIACPCGNPPSGPLRGCNNSSNTGGATLTAAGVASVSADTLVFTSTDLRATVICILLQGDEEIGSLTFGDGVRCIGENLKRLYTKTSTAGGVIIAPQGAELSVTARAAALGAPILPGTERRYQVHYRDGNPTFGCTGVTPGGSRFNISVGLRVPWDV